MPKTLLCQRFSWMEKPTIIKKPRFKWLSSIVTGIVFGTWRNVSKFYLEKWTGENVLGNVSKNV